MFYLGDGEQTAAGEPPPFTIPAGLIHGGAVLGYGTADGGRMKSTRARYDASPSYIQDPTTGRTRSRSSTRTASSSWPNSSACRTCTASQASRCCRRWLRSTSPATH